MSIIKPLGLQKITALGKDNNKIQDSLFHVVNPKDNLLSISQRYSVSPSELKKINGLKNDKIYLGQVINLKNKNIVKESEDSNNEKEVRRKNPIPSSSEKDLIIDPSKFLPSLNSKFPFENFKFRDTYYMDFGFTINYKLQDNLIYCLNAICWIQHHECYETYERDTIKSHFIYVNVFYMNKLGEIVLGKQIVLDFKTQAQKIPNADAYAYQVKLLTSPPNKNVYEYLSIGKELHNEIFIEKKYKFKQGLEYDIKDSDRAFQVLKKASLNNRQFDTNFIYSSVAEEKEKVEKILDYISVAAIPFEIPLKLVKAIQKTLEFIAYASDLDSQTKLLDKLFNERGPFPLSPIYKTTYELQQVYDPSGNPVGGYKQVKKGDTITYKEDFIMDEILTILQNDLVKKKS